jgi:pimeloyl-ACP methyl ester carboxylesterase
VGCRCPIGAAIGATSVGIDRAARSRCARGEDCKQHEPSFDFAGDLPPEEARVLYATHQPFKKSLTTEKTTNAAWRTKPTFYAVSTQDRTINPDMQRFMAKRMGAKTIEVEASHLALLSRRGAITNLILEGLAV